MSKTPRTDKIAINIEGAVLATDIDAWVPYQFASDLEFELTKVKEERDALLTEWRSRAELRSEIEELKAKLSSSLEDLKKADQRILELLNGRTQDRLDILRNVRAMLDAKRKVYRIEWAIEAVEMMILKESGVVGLL